MRTLSLAGIGAAALALTVTSSFAGESGSRSRFWDYYNPYPSNYIGSPEWLAGPTLLGDWWGVRNWLDDNGIEFSGSYTNNIAGNVTGGNDQGFTYCDNILVGVALDLEKIAGWKGASITVSGLNRDGSNLSQDYIGNQFTVQQVYGGSAVMLYELALEQKLMEDKVSIKVGRFATGDDFASSPLYWLYMNNGIDGNPQALPVNSQFSAYPWAVWAARLKVQPTPEWTGQLGIYQVSSRVFNRNYHGVDFSIRPDDGFLLISQFGWSPEFFKREVPTNTTRDGKQVVDSKSVVDGKSTKSFKEPVEMKGLKGHYWFGVYWSPWSYPVIGGTPDQKAQNAYGFYWHADQMVFQEAPGSDQGLYLWSAFVLSPQQNIAKLPFEANFGVAYQGLIPTRDTDWTTFGFVYGSFSDQQPGATPDDPKPNYELVLEGGYKIQLTKFAFIQPDIQYVINPGGNPNIGNALVLGAQMGVTF